MRNPSSTPDLCKNTEKENCFKETVGKLNQLDQEIPKYPAQALQLYNELPSLDISNESSFVQKILKQKSLSLITKFIKKGFSKEKITRIVSQKTDDFLLDSQNEEALAKESKKSENVSNIQEVGKSKDQSIDNEKKEKLNKKTEVTDLKKTVFANIEPQNIIGLRENVLSQLKDASIDVDTYNRAIEFVDEHKAKLQSLRPLFQSGEEAIFGQIVKSTKLNLTSQNPDEIYADLFIQVDSRITDEDRKATLKSSIAEKLGFKYQGRPADAGNLKSQILLRKRAITENQKDESGEDVQFDTNHPIVMSQSPHIIVYPKGHEYICEGKIDGLGTESLKMKFSEKMSNTELNNRMNKFMLDALFSNHQNSGVINAIYGTGANIGGTDTHSESKALGDSAMTEAITEMFLGQSILDGARFIQPDELANISDNIRWLVPDGNLGVFNSIDPQSAVALMKGLGFDATDQGKANMKRAGQLFQGNTGEKSYQMLYDLMYPDDQGNGYNRLKKILGKERFKKAGF